MRARLGDFWSFAGAGIIALGVLIAFVLGACIIAVEVEAGRLFEAAVSFVGMVAIGLIVWRVAE